MGNHVPKENRQSALLRHKLPTGDKEGPAAADAEKRTKRLPGRMAFDSSQQWEAELLPIVPTRWDDSACQ